jgi:hypothetical protein
MPSFPTFENAGVVHYPYTTGVEYLNTVYDMPHGYRYAFNHRPTPLRKWSSTYSFSDTDLQTWNAFYTLVRGNYALFSYTDPLTGLNYPRCRLDMDANSVIDAGPNEHQVTVTILELP